MNKIRKYILAMLVAVFAASSCTDFVDPAIPYNNFETGVYLRTLKTAGTTFNYFDMANATLSVVVEVVDEEGGKLLKDVVVSVRHRRGNTFLTNEVAIMTINANDFKPAPYPDRNFPLAPERSFPWYEIKISATETMSKLGITLDNINGGDLFEYRLELHDTKGRTFTNTNLSGDVAGGAYYASPFFYRVSVVCPSELAGTYDLSTTGWCGSTYEGKVKFVAGTTAGTYIIQVDLDGTFVDDFSFGFYRACYGPSTAPPGGANGLRFTDSCGRVGFNSATSSPWGDSFKLKSVTVNDNVLILDIETSYAPEQGVATITRTDGKNWPPLKL